MRFMCLDTKGRILIFSSWRQIPTMHRDIWMISAIFMKNSRKDCQKTPSMRYPSWSWPRILRLCWYGIMSLHLPYRKRSILMIVMRMMMRWSHSLKKIISMRKKQQWSDYLIKRPWNLLIIRGFSQSVPLDPLLLPKDHWLRLLPDIRT